MELNQLTIHALRDKLRAGETTAVATAESVFGRIDAVEGKVHAYISLMRDEALKMAADADRRIQNGDQGDLCGIPVALKDILCTHGFKTTCGSHILHNFIPPYDATVVAALKQVGAVFVGKANMDEFAMGSSTETSWFGVTHNPWDLDRIPGGSSGGSAAAVAADECIASLGTDTGGSIRQPASLCGVVGMKPTYGRVSRYGMIAFASSLDQAGPITRSVADAAALLGIIAGHDPRDSTCVDAPVPDYLAAVGKPVKGMRIGLPREYFEGEGLDPEVKAAVERALESLTDQGAEVVEVSLPHTGYALSTYYLIAPSEASSNLARYDGVRYGHRAEGAAGLIEMMSKTRAEGFGAEVKRRVMIGTYALSAGYYEAFYGKAQKVRTLIRRDFTEAFEKADALLTPTTPTPAFRIGEKTDDPLTMYLSDIFTIPCNLAGIPGISVPCGFSAEGLPVGAQLLAGPFREETLFTAAAAIERAVPAPSAARNE